MLITVTFNCQLPIVNHQLTIVNHQLTIINRQSSIAHADVMLDGTMGTAGQITGPVYDIKAEYGQQAGANLFHSFRQFDINSGETADFRVSADINNIISRVTGGSHSWVDGTLCSTLSGTAEISGANLYLLNPAGVMFGPHASLNIGGSFHVSTADYLRMGETGRFYAAPGNDMLSLEPPVAFGFLDNDIALISFEGKGEIEQADWDENPAGLSVSEGKSISVIGGDIEITGTYYQYNDVGIPVGNLNAPEGRINMASVASPGEVIPVKSDLNVSSGKLGNIKISDYSLIKVSGEGSGNIYIRSGVFFAENGSAVEADAKRDKDGGTTDIRVGTLTLKDSNIFSDTEGKGVGGNISVHASESVNMSHSRIFADATGEGSNTGSAGSVFIETEKLLLDKVSIISGETYGKSSGGNVSLHIEDSVNLKEESQIFSRSTGSQTDAGAGSAGTIYIETKNISSSDISIISSETYKDGNAGTISIYAKDAVSLSNSFVTTSTSGKGEAGDITLTAGRLELNSGSSVSSASNLKEQGGDAGTINIKVSDSFTLNGASAITTQAQDAGKGRIIIETGNQFYSTDSSVTTSIRGGGNDAGDISISQKTLILNKGDIVANAYEGRGGNIHIVANPMVQSYDSSVDASSELGIDGTVYIEAPDEDAGSGLLVLPASYLDAAQWMKTPCALRSVEKVSRFVFIGIDGVPDLHDDLLASPLFMPDTIEASDSEDDGN